MDEEDEAKEIIREMLEQSKVMVMTYQVNTGLTYMYIHSVRTLTECTYQS